MIFVQVSVLAHSVVFTFNNVRRLDALRIVTVVVIYECAFVEARRIILEVSTMQKSVYVCRNTQ